LHFFSTIIIYLSKLYFREKNGLKVLPMYYKYPIIYHTNLKQTIVDLHFKSVQCLSHNIQYYTLCPINKHILPIYMWSVLHHYMSNRGRLLQKSINFL